MSGYTTYMYGSINIRPREWRVVVMAGSKGLKRVCAVFLLISGSGGGVRL